MWQATNSTDRESGDLDGELECFTPNVFSINNDSDSFDRFVPEPDKWRKLKFLGKVACVLTITAPSLILYVLSIKASGDLSILYVVSGVGTNFPINCLATVKGINYYREIPGKLKKLATNNEKVGLGLETLLTTGVTLGTAFPAALLNFTFSEGELYERLLISGSSLGGQFFVNSFGVTGLYFNVLKPLAISTISWVSTSKIASFFYVQEEFEARQATYSLQTYTLQRLRTLELRLKRYTPDALKNLGERMQGGSLTSGDNTRNYNAFLSALNITSFTDSIERNCWAYLGSISPFGLGNIAGLIAGAGSIGYVCSVAGGLGKEGLDSDLGWIAAIGSVGPSMGLGFLAGRGLVDRVWTFLSELAAGRIYLPFPFNMVGKVNLSVGVLAIAVPLIMGCLSGETGSVLYGLCPQIMVDVYSTAVIFARTSAFNIYYATLALMFALESIKKTFGSDQEKAFLLMRGFIEQTIKRVSESSLDAFITETLEVTNEQSNASGETKDIYRGVEDSKQRRCYEQVMRFFNAGESTPLRRDEEESIFVDEKHADSSTTYGI